MDLYVVLFVIFIVMVVAFLTFSVIMYIRQCKRNKLKKETPVTEAPKIKDEFDTVKFYATVVDLFCRTEMIGTKAPRSVKVFTVVFETDNKKRIKLDVPEEMYDGIETGQSGEVTVVEGELYSFVI
ncbi:MAG: DUF2500 family protein [Acutalibacteraceae bacterium]|nr:DUF2500 family protein [Acutalibacteraceae bacterium]